MKHLGFIWDIKRNFGRIGEKNIEERVSKFWAVIHALIKGGIRFCHPGTIVEMFNTLAVPTLIYGLELMTLSSNQMSYLDVEARKALKFLFNLSYYSKNYLHTFFNLDSVSTLIINNKLNLLSRLMQNDITRDVIISLLKSKPTYQSFTQECYEITEENRLNFSNILLNIKSERIRTIQKEIPINEKMQLDNYINFWNVKEARKHFKELMERKIPAT